MRAALPEGYVLRPATPADIAILVEHRLAMFLDMSTEVDAGRLRSSFASWLDAHMRAGTYRAWLVQAEGGLVVGGGGITIMPWPPGPRSFTGQLPIVFNVYTAPAHRRRGLARALMSSIHAWCRDAGFNVIALSASEEGRPLYETLGYEPSRQPYMFCAL